jgi:hypothetical protein
MAQKDLIIGAFNNYTDYDVLKPWVQSIKDTGFKGDVVLIAIGTTPELIKKLIEEGVIVVSVPRNDNMMIHMQRFIYIYNFLKENRNVYRYVISTDVRDVIFQFDPTDYLENCFHSVFPSLGILASSESIKIKDEEWNRENIRKNFGDYFYKEVQENDVCNVGILAGKSEFVKELCFYLYQFSTNRPDWVADQAAYNMLLNTDIWNTKTSIARLKDAWALNAHVTNKPDLIEKLKPYLLEETPTMSEDGLIRNSKGVPFIIVHQYDRVPEWMEYFSKKYGINITKDTNTGTSPKYTLSKQ